MMHSFAVLLEDICLEAAAFHRRNRFAAQIGCHSSEGFAKIAEAGKTQ
jgi:hypothetical protein